MKRVLIAHQSTIPHYRVPFYNALEELRPRDWSFDVVFDPTELTAPRFFKEALDPTEFAFSRLSTTTHQAKLLGKQATYQSFWRQAGRYDLVIVENAINNLTYPLCQLHQLRGVRFAYWGHGRDMEVQSPGLAKRTGEKLKLALVRRADGFFAYTPGVKQYLEAQQIDSKKIFVLNNTIDIAQQRQAFEAWLPRRAALRAELGARLGIDDPRVLLFVGRFTPNKRLDFLLDAFALLRARDPRFGLVLVGPGAHEVPPIPGMEARGSIVELEQLAPIYVAADLFAFPGAVGLAPFQALCYDLPVLTIDSPIHGPEIEYLTPANTVILPATTTPQLYAEALHNLFDTPGKLDELRRGVWPSICHLTIEQMAQNFISGVDQILRLGETGPQNRATNS